MKIFNKAKEDSSWVSVSDLMSVLMMIFLFVSIAYMMNVQEEKYRIESIAVTYEKTQAQLVKELEREFGNDMKVWDAVLDTNLLSIQFKNPEILFKIGSTELNDNFKIILDDFFPRFLGILTNPKYKNDIEEIRIEGHTSKEWAGENNPRQAYFKNMELSQGRTRRVLEHVLSGIQNNELFSWTQNNLTANGLSSSKPILDVNNQEDKDRSRRVEFRIKTNAEKQIVKILKETQQ